MLISAISLRTSLGDNNSTLRALITVCPPRDSYVPAGVSQAWRRRGRDPDNDCVSKTTIAANENFSVVHLQGKSSVQMVLTLTG